MQHQCLLLKQALLLINEKTKKIILAIMSFIFYTVDFLGPPIVETLQIHV